MPLVKRALSTLALSVVLPFGLMACDSGPKADGGKADTGKADTGKADTGKDEPDPESAGDAGKAEEGLHFDIGQDHAGFLARAASTLEATESIAADSPVHEHLMSVSHHTEAGPSNEALCKHIFGLGGTPADPEKDKAALDECGKTLEHERVQLGPEVFKAMATCVMDAKDPEAFGKCEDAEHEAESQFHAHTHGDGLSEEDCTKLVDHFGKLAQDDAKDDAEKATIDGILADVRADLILVCQEEGMQAELDCALKAETMEALGKCDEESMYSGS